MTDPGHDVSTDIDAAAADFCNHLNLACALPNDMAFAAWSVADKVDNPDPLGWHDTSRLHGLFPSRTLRYGMPRFERPRPRLTFAVSPNKSSAFRTPVEQAKEVSARPKVKSWVCWGAHMSDKARHILPRIDGVPYTSGSEFKRALGKHFPWFVAQWKDALRTCDLRDANGGQDWFEGDELHVELPDGKISQLDARAGACVDEYVRLINTGAGQRNHKFELRLQPHLRLRLGNLAQP